MKSDLRKSDVQITRMTRLKKYFCNAYYLNNRNTSGVGSSLTFLFVCLKKSSIFNNNCNIHCFLLNAETYYCDVRYKLIVLPCLRSWGCCMRDYLKSGTNTFVMI